MLHELKIKNEYFEAVQAGIKNFEIRKADRPFRIGDKLLLREWYHGNYTGREIKRKICYIYKGDGTFGLSEEYWILGLESLPTTVCIQNGVNNTHITNVGTLNL